MNIMSNLLIEHELKFSKSNEEISNLLNSSEDYVYIEGENDSLIKIKNSIENSIRKTAMVNGGLISAVNGMLTL